MAKTILTPFQQKLLDLIAEDPYITKHFYLTGGTALSEFYLKHRVSEDFDLFSENEVHLSPVVSFLTKIAPKIGILEREHRPFMGLHSFMLRLQGGRKFKIDFNYYPQPRISIKKKYKNLHIDSIYDIAVNKVHTMFMKPRARDYIDIYFIIAQEKYPMEQLILDAKAKFDWHIDPLLLGSQLKKITDIADLPKMLVSFDQKDMEQFFLKLAKSLEGDIFK